MIIDSHLHLNSVDGSYDEAYEQLLLDMKKNNVDKCIIIPDNVVGSGCADLQTALKYLSDKCFVVGSPNILEPKVGGIELFDKLLSERKIIGLKFFPGHDAFYANDQRCDKYFELATKHNCPVIFHTGINSDDEECAKYNDPKYLTDVAKHHPDLRIVISHYFWPKMEYCYEMTRGFSNIYFDASAMADPEVVGKSGGIEMVRRILEKTLADCSDSVLFGTDYSMCEIGPHMELINSLDIDDETKQGIWSKNAEALFNI